MSCAIFNLFETFTTASGKYCDFRRHLCCCMKMGWVWSGWPKGVIDCKVKWRKTFWDEENPEPQRSDWLIWVVFIVVTKRWMKKHWVWWFGKGILSKSHGSVSTMTYDVPLWITRKHYTTHGVWQFGGFDNLELLCFVMILPVQCCKLFSAFEEMWIPTKLNRYKKLTVNLGAWINSRLLDFDELYNSSLAWVYPSPTGPLWISTLHSHPWGGFFVWPLLSTHMTHTWNEHDAWFHHEQLTTSKDDLVGDCSKKVFRLVKYHSSARLIGYGRAVTTW